MVSENCAIIIQARNTSKRLPGKATLPLPNGLTPVQVLELRLLDWPIIWALADEPESDAIISSLHNIDAPLHLCIKGAVDDVAMRRWQAAQMSDADYFMILGADDFLMAPEAVETAFEDAIYNDALTEYKQGLYVQTVGWPFGMNPQVVTTRQGIEEAAYESTPDEREHITLFYDRRPDRYPCSLVHRYDDDSDLRIALDTGDDYAMMSLLISRYGWNATTGEMIQFLRANPDFQVNVPHYVPEGTPIREGAGRLVVAHDPKKGDL